MCNMSGLGRNLGANAPQSGSLNSVGGFTQPSSGTASSETSTGGAAGFALGPMTAASGSVA